MQKFIFYFLTYIGLSLAVFNHAEAKQLSVPLPFEEVFNPEEKTTQGPPVLEIKADNEFFKVYAVFLFVDKIFADQKINNTEAVTNFLHMVWPKTDIDKLRAITPYLQFFVASKRRYVYTVNHLKQKIKAAAILPQDAPVVAAKGDFAPKYSDERKKTGHDQYKVSYTPYRYLEYDNQELGEPVRRRDKNYKEVNESVIDEIVLALLQFKLSDFINALKKLPPDNDGSREVPVELENNLLSRIVLATASPGSKETIKGVIEIAVPEGWYINGDYLNPRAKPKFFLKEDKEEDLNIKEYQLFYPEAVGVVNNGQTSRILVDDVKFPITFTRRDVEKDLNIKGQFVFEVCKAKTKDCHHVVSNNSLFLERSLDEDDSIHHNFVTIEFNRLPPSSTRHAKLESAIYNPATQRLNLRFKTTKKFSNVAAMVEDADETNFLDAKYRIKDDMVEISYKIDTLKTDRTDTPKEDSIKSISEGGEIAVTAAFDEFEVMRTVIIPDKMDIPSEMNYPTFPNYVLAFIYGVLLPLMPGVSYLLQRLLQALYQNERRKKIFIRYLKSTLISIAVYGVYLSSHPWYQLYENKWLSLSMVMLGTSYLVASWNYMDFDLFRPLKSIAPRGWFLGIFTILMSLSVPTLYKAEVMDNLVSLNQGPAIGMLCCIWLGLISIPSLGLLFHKHIKEIPLKMQYLNRAYTAIFVIMILYTATAVYGINMLIILLLTALLTGFIWYVYPLAIAETIRHGRSINSKFSLFTKVQHHGFIAIMVIGLVSAVMIAFISPKKVTIPSVYQMVAKAQTQIASDKSLLFILSADWHIESWLKEKIFDKMDKDRVIIKQYPLRADNQQAKEWLKTYAKKSPPLHVLFTLRHPKGLVLPDNLAGINWEEAVKDFIPTTSTLKEER